MFTNEAGLGTSAMAMAPAQVDHPARQGMWGIFEVFCSTLVVCTVTALVILVSGAYDPEAALVQLQTGTVPDAAMGVPLTARAFSSVLGPAGTWAVSLSLVLFAFSSILGWSCYWAAEPPLSHRRGPPASRLPGRCSCCVLSWGRWRTSRPCGSWWTCATR